MDLNKESQWLCENSKMLEQYSGQWVLFHPDQGIVGSAHSFQKALAKFSKSRSKDKPFVFHVPDSDTVVSPLWAARNIR